MERERGKETEGIRETEKKISLPCGGLAGQRSELKMFEVQTNLEAKLYSFPETYSFNLFVYLHVCVCAGVPAYTLCTTV